MRDAERRLRKENGDYLEKMKAILTAPRKGSRKSSDMPAELLDFLYIGNRDEARTPYLLKLLKITHVLNCAGRPGDYPDRNNPYDPETTGVVAYEQFEALDNDGYQMLKHFRKARKFIDDARDTGGHVLVHCELGVNRSGCICIAYMMLEQGITLLQALRRIKMERPVVLCNEGFQRELIDFARDHDLLYREGATSTSSLT